MKRKLTTIFCADVSGYSRMMGVDEARTLETLKEYREAIEGFIDRHHGRVVSWSGDGLLAEFASVVEAVQCAAEVQRELRARNASREPDRQMVFRIGVNLGDVMADGDDIFGEGVNIAARLQQIAAPGGILISSPVYDQVRGKLSMGFSPLGAQHVKNIASEISVYSVTVDGVARQNAIDPARREETIAQPPPAGDERAARRFRREDVRRRRGGLINRAFAGVTDYAIVALIALAAAIGLNMAVSPTTIRMDLEIPFIDYGEAVESTPWRQTAAEQSDRTMRFSEERRVTYDYLGLFTQTYLQTRTRRMIQENADPAAPTAPPAAAAPPAQPAPPVGAGPAPPPAPPPPPPAPPATFSIPGLTVEHSVGRNDDVTIAPDGSIRIGDDEENGATLAIDHDDASGWKVRYSDIHEQLVDSSGAPIARPSLDTISLALFALLMALFEMGRRGASPGKRIFEIAVERQGGAPLSFGASLIRNVVKALCILILPVQIGFILFSRSRRGIHDRLAGTFVYSREA